MKGSSLYASRSNCEPTQSPWEPSSGSALVVAPAGTHLFIQVRRQSGNGKLGPLRPSPGPPMRRGPEREPAGPGRPIGVLALVVVFLLHDPDGRRRAASRGDRDAPRPRRRRRRSRRRSRRRRPTPPPPAPSVPDADRDRGRRDFKAGPGLPADSSTPTTTARSSTLLIVRAGGIDDQRRARDGRVASLARRHRRLRHQRRRTIAEYSRITQGVDVDRVPALIVLDAPSGSTEGDDARGRGRLRLPRPRQRRPGASTTPSTTAPTDLRYYP